MRMRTITCSACGAPILFEVGSSFAKCKYCDTIQYLDVETPEASDMKLPARTDTPRREERDPYEEKRDFYAEEQRRNAQKQYEAEKQQYQAEYDRYRKFKLGWLVALGVLFVTTGMGIGDTAGWFVAVLIFGGIAVRMFKPKQGSAPAGGYGDPGGTRQAGGDSYRSPLGGLHEDGPYRAYTSDKQKLTAFLLCLFLGAFGVHQFYVGRVGKGLLYLFTAGLLGIGVIVDLIMIATGTFKDAAGRPLG